MRSLLKAVVVTSLAIPVLGISAATPNLGAAAIAATSPPTNSAQFPNYAPNSPAYLPNTMPTVALADIVSVDAVTHLNIPSNFAPGNYKTYDTLKGWARAQRPNLRRNQTFLITGFLGTKRPVTTERQRKDVAALVGYRTVATINALDGPFIGSTAQLPPNVTPEMLFSTPGFSAKKWAENKVGTVLIVTTKQPVSEPDPVYLPPDTSGDLDSVVSDPNARAAGVAQP